MFYVLVILTVVIGALLPVQAGLNAEVTRLLKHPFMGALMSFSIGTITLSTIIFFHKSPVGDIKRILSIPPQYFLGGMMGALFVASSIFMIPRLGATTTMAAFVTGQLISSIIIDHNGWLHMPTYPVTSMRVVGVVLLFAGLFLVVKKTA